MRGRVGERCEVLVGIFRAGEFGLLVKVIRDILLSVCRSEEKADQAVME